MRIAFGCFCVIIVTAANEKQINGSHASNEGVVGPTKPIRPREASLLF
jgi:hypothetical protein